MFKSACLLLKLFNCIGRISGRKKLQKMVYLMITSGMDLQYKYVYHHYGPYSAQLQDEINFLVRQGLLQETKNDDTYLYEITDRGQDFINLLGSSHDIALDQELINSLKDKGSQFLEMVSTYAYLLDSGYNENDAMNKAIELKSHLKGYVEESVEFFYKNIVRDYSGSHC